MHKSLFLFRLINNVLIQQGIPLLVDLLAEALAAN
jgi:hypothetical protein